MGQGGESDFAYSRRVRFKVRNMGSQRGRDKKSNSMVFRRGETRHKYFPAETFNEGARGLHFGFLCT